MYGNNLIGQPTLLWSRNRPIAQRRTIVGYLVNPIQTDTASSRYTLSSIGAN